jgi:hypothetical protein
VDAELAADQSEGIQGKPTSLRQAPHTVAIEERLVGRPEARQGRLGAGTHAGAERRHRRLQAEERSWLAGGAEGR